MTGRGLLGAGRDAAVARSPVSYICPVLDDGARLADLCSRVAAAHDRDTNN